MNVVVSGLNGFVGGYLKKYLIDHSFNLIRYNFEYKDNLNSCNPKVVIHLAGKAHDLKKGNSKEYFLINTDLTKVIFDDFLNSDAHTFIFVSSVKAVKDEVDGVLDENVIPSPVTDYGKSKLLAEEYILNLKLNTGKRIIILRPCMIHGPHNKGNLNFLFKFLTWSFFWPLGSFNNKRSFCSIENLSFLIKEIIENPNISSGIYNVADDEPISTNELVILISKILKKKIFILKIPKTLVLCCSRVFDMFNIFLTTEKLQKLTENYIVSNHKIKSIINKELPLKTKEGLIYTLKSFNH